MTTPKLPFLVVSASPYMRGILKFVLETMLHTEVTELESEEKALSFLKDLESFPSMIVYDYMPNAYLLEDFVGYLKENSKLVRIVVLVDKIREEGKDLLKDQEQMILMDESHLPGNLVEESKLLFQGSPYLNEEAYCRIDINFLSILDGINKNLFIKIGQDKFIKLFNEDDNTNIPDIQKYKSKGINYLYLNRETANWVINQIQSQIDIFLKANNFRFILRGATDTAEKRFEQKILRIDDEVHMRSFMPRWSSCCAMMPCSVSSSVPQTWSPRRRRTSSRHASRRFRASSTSSPNAVTRTCTPSSLA